MTTQPPLTAKLFLCCPQCATKNREIAKYCKHCGKQLEQCLVDKNKLQTSAYIYQDRKISDEELNLLKQRINQWINSIPHHKFQNFINEIQITSVKEAPVYESTLELLYEKREFQLNNVPYRGMKTFQPKKTISEIDIWNTPMVLIKKEFKESKKEYALNDTYSANICWVCKGGMYLTCDDCSGKGIVKCDDCRGAGQFLCFRCDGKGRVRCFSCSNGRIECSWCGGRGVIEKSEYIGGERRTISIPCTHCRGAGYKPCDRCAATGYVVCSECDGSGRIVCSYCRGTGLVHCSNCEGSGRVNCYFCGATGKILSYYSIIQISSIQSLNCISFGHISKEVVLNNNNLCYGENFNDLLKKQKVTVVEFTTDTLDDLKQLVSDAVEHPFVKQDVLALTESLKKDNDNGKLITLKLSISKLSVYEINYQFEKKMYSIYISGNDILDSSIFAVTSPVKEFIAELVTQFKQEIESSEFTSAWLTFSKLEDLISEKEQLISLVDLIMDKELSIVPEVKRRCSAYRIYTVFANQLRVYKNRVKSEFLVVRITENIFKKFYIPQVDKFMEKKKFSKVDKLLSLFFHIKDIIGEDSFKLFMNSETSTNYFSKLLYMLEEKDRLLSACKLISSVNLYLDKKLSGEKVLQSIQNKWWLANIVILGFYLVVVYPLCTYLLAQHGLKYSSEVSTMFLFVSTLIASIPFSQLSFLYTRYSMWVLLIPGLVTLSLCFLVANGWFLARLIMGGILVFVEEKSGVITGCTVVLIVCLYLIAQIKKSQLIKLIKGVS